jgi:16S rRNA (cytosine967-C5)-methyltransferase
VARSAPAGDRSASPARVCAYDVVRRVFEHGAYADRALHSHARDLDPRERALAAALVYGTVQRRATLDALAATLVKRPLRRLEPAVLAGLRLGLFQILFLNGVADHAAVNETVALVKPLSRGGASLTNAVLRRAAREGPGWLASLCDDTPAVAAIAHSIPAWLATRWWDELGADSARALMAAVNRPAESALRVNTLVAQLDEVLAELPVGARPAAGLPEALVLDGAFDAFGSGLWERGALMPQSRGSMLVARALAPEPGAAVLDLCAAPGAKTTHLAALGAGRVVAVERNPRRAEGLKDTAARMRAGAVAVREFDAAIVGSPVAPVGLGPEDRFDGVLVDPPCSGLGTLQSRPDIRWHATPEQIEELAGLQARILAAGARATRPGGALVYSVCTISRAEGERVMEDFLIAHPDFAPEPLAPRHPEFAAAAQGPYLQLRPDRDGTDGFFIARLLRAA